MKRVLVLNYEFPPLGGPSPRRSGFGHAGGEGGVAAQKLAKGFVQAGYEVD